MRFCYSTKLYPYNTVDTVEMTASYSTNETEAQTPSTKVGKTTYHLQEDESVTEAVVRAVCSGTESDQSDLPPLYSVVDTDALNVLFTPNGRGRSRLTDGVVAFRYAGKQVEITSENTVKISEIPVEENVPTRL